MSKPLVSCIVVSYNSSQYIKECLHALQKISYSNVEILLVDNGSTDNTLSLVKSFSSKVKVIKNEKNTGYAGGHALGMSRAKGKYFFLLNPDTTVTPGFLDPLVKKMESDSKIAAGQPLVYLAGDKKVVNLSGKVTHYLGFDWLRDYKSTEARNSGEIISFSGSGILLSAAAINKVGGLDESYFMYYEDSDLGWRLRMNGYKLWFCAESVIYHDYKFVPDEKYQSFNSKLFWAERNRLYTFFKNYSLSTLLLLLPIFLLMEFCLLGYFTLQGLLKVKLKSYGSLWSSRKQLSMSRKDVQSSRSVEDRQVVKNFETKIEFSLFNHPVIKYILNPILSIYWNIIWPLV